MVIYHMMTGLTLKSMCKINQTVLFRRIRRNVFLRQPVILTSSPETTALENQAVIAPNRWHLAVRPQGSETMQTGVFQGSFRFFGAASAGELVRSEA